MKLRELKDLVRTALKEVNAVGSGGASFSAGDGMNYATPRAFGGGKRAKKTLVNFGYKEVKRPKHPSHTKGFDYL